MLVHLDVVDAVSDLARARANMLASFGLDTSDNAGGFDDSDGQPFVDANDGDAGGLEGVWEDVQDGSAALMEAYRAFQIGYVFLAQVPCQR